MPTLNSNLTSAPAPIAIVQSPSVIAPEISLGLNKAGQGLATTASQVSSTYKSIGDQSQVGMNLFAAASFATVADAQQLATQLNGILAQIQAYVRAAPGTLQTGTVAVPAALQQTAAQLTAWSKNVSMMGDTYTQLAANYMTLQNKLATAQGLIASLQQQVGALQSKVNGAITAGGNIGGGAPAPAASTMSTGEKVGIGAAVVLGLGGLAWYFTRHAA